MAHPSRARQKPAWAAHGGRGGERRNRCLTVAALTAGASISCGRMGVLMHLRWTRFWAAAGIGLGWTGGCRIEIGSLDALPPALREWLLDGMRQAVAAYLF
ncbi:MAG: hypothetical protein AMXMBFR83_15110 [Phycisphaerae bacterium]